MCAMFSFRHSGSLNMEAEVPQRVTPAAKTLVNEIKSNLPPKAAVWKAL